MGDSDSPYEKYDYDIQSLDDNLDNLYINTQQYLEGSYTMSDSEVNPESTVEVSMGTFNEDSQSGSISTAQESCSTDISEIEMNDLIS